MSVLKTNVSGEHTPQSKFEQEVLFHAEESQYWLNVSKEALREHIFALEQYIRHQEELAK